MDRNLALEAVRVTEAAALASARLMGRDDRDGADRAAVEAMRLAFQDLSIRGEVVIGEGERDEAPMLYIGEKVGRAADGDLAVDIAVDPLEGTNLCATGSPNALGVIAMGEKGKFLRAPDTYMEKIAVGPSARGAIDLRRSPTENLHAIADALGKYVEDLTVVILDRPRHEALVREVRAAARGSSSSRTATSPARSPPASRTPASTSSWASAAHRRASSPRRRSAASAATCRGGSGSAATPSGSGPGGWASWTSRR